MKKQITPDEFFKLFGLMISGLNSLDNEKRGEGWGAMIILKQRLKLSIPPTADECEAAARKIFESFLEQVILETRNSVAHSLNQWLSSLDGKPTINDFERLVLDLQSSKGDVQTKIKTLEEEARKYKPLLEECKAALVRCNALATKALEMRAALIALMPRCKHRGDPETTVDCGKFASWGMMKSHLYCEEHKYPEAPLNMEWEVARLTIEPIESKGESQ